MKQVRMSQLAWLGALFALFLSTQSLARELPDFTELAAQNSPAVVNISTVYNGKSGKQRMPRNFSMPDLPEDHPFNDLFKKFFEDGAQGKPHSEARSLGSGFVISADGYILTNHHVVEDADEIVVRFSDRRAYTAELIGSDKGSDVALLKIDAEDLPTLKLGKSSDLDVGSWVLAIGSPFGFDHTVTAGIVSAKGRSLPSENYVPFIQTDVAINPGNSGGPLFNLDGEVIGINAQIYSRTGGFMGLSFAIPIELAMNVADQLRENGSVARGYIGVLIQDVDRDLAESFGMPHPRGALVSRVLPDSPAEDAGLQAGDVILEYNGHRLLNSSQLPPLVGTSRIDQAAELRLLRAGDERTVTITIGQLPDEDGRAIPARFNGPKGHGGLGLRFEDVRDKAREELGLEESGGAQIVRVQDGPARTAGLRKGDVISMFDGVKVRNADHLDALIEAAAGKRSVAVLVNRRNGPMFLALRMDG